MDEKRLLYVEGVLLFVAFIWGINAPIMKVGLVYVPPLAYNALRMLLALVFAFAVLKVSGAARPVAREDWRKIALVSIAGFFVFQLFFTGGVERTTAGNASLLLGLLPVSVAVVNKLWGIENITLSVFAGIVTTLGGVLLIVIGSGRTLSLENNHLIGAFMLLLAQSGYGYYTVFSKELTARYSSYQITAYVMAVTTGLFVAVAIPQLHTLAWEEIPGKAWLSIIFSGVFALCIGNFLWIWGIGKIGSTKASLYNNLSPVFAIITGYLFLGEPFGWLQFAGAVVIFCGLYITRTKGAIFKYLNLRNKQENPGD